MVYRLEAPEYGFRCCFADRDFDLGVPVFQNIIKCIHSSKRTVIVLSPEFLESPWCSYETRITMELDMDTRQRLLIPVMLRNCKIPDFIGRLTYMEVQNEHFWERFVAALQSDEIGSLVIQEEVGSSAIMATAPFQFNPNFLNAEEIVEVSVYRHGNFFCKREPTNQMPNELLRHGLQITPGEYVEILTTITKQFYVRCHPFYTKLWLYFFLELFIPAFVMAFLTLIPEVYGTVAMNLYISVSLVCGILTLLIFLVHYAAILQAARYFPDAIESANRIASRKNMMISVKEYGCCDGALDQVSIIFYYYDWRPCLSHLRNFLAGQCGFSEEEANSISDESSKWLGLDQTTNTVKEVKVAIEDEAMNMLVRHSVEYSYLLINRRYATPIEQRHTRQGACLCQFVEDLLQSQEKSCIDCIWRQQS